MKDQGLKLFLPVFVVVLAVVIVVGVLLMTGYLSQHRAPTSQPQPQPQPTEQPPSQAQPQPQPQPEPKPEQPKEQTAPTKAEQPQPTPEPEPKPKPAAQPKHPTLGDPDAPVTIIEFADFYCPFCARFLWETKPKIIKDYVEKGLVRYEFRNLVVHGFPALLAAVAGECAQRQGKFWELHERIYEEVFKGDQHQQLDVKGLEALAADAGLNEKEFAVCIESYQFDLENCLTDYKDCIGENPDQEREQQCLQDFNDCLLRNPLAAEVFADQQSLRELMNKVPEEEQTERIGTPLFFIGNHLLVGAQPYERFQEVIDQALREAGVSPKD